MALTTFLFLAFFLFCLMGCIFVHPILGIVGYTVVYTLAPAQQWWGSAAADYGLRYSLLMVIALIIGLIFHKNRLELDFKLTTQEILLFLFICWIFASSYVGLPGAMAENFGVKMTKVAIFLWLFTRIVNDLKGYEILLWTLVLTGFYLGFEALGTSTEYYGRLDRGVGGSDFSEGNFLAAHLAMLLPFAGVLFLLGGKKQKFLILVSSVLIVNAIILCRSRGIFLALLAGIFSAIVMAPKGLRKRLIALLLVGSVGSLFLVDADFWERMSRINLDVTNIESQDDSASGRIHAWKAAIEMAKMYPLGIGEGNFAIYVGMFSADVPGKDTHNTPLRCLAELGFPGLILYLMMVANAFLALRRMAKNVADMPDEERWRLHIYGLFVALVIFITAGMFITHTYIEELYWLLMMPIVLERIMTKEKSTQLSEDTTINIQQGSNYTG